MVVATAPAASGIPAAQPSSCIARWIVLTDETASEAHDRRIFYWEMMLRLGMEDILKSMYSGAFSAHMSKGRDSDLVDKALLQIRTDLQTIDSRQKRSVLEHFFRHIATCTRSL